MKVCPCCGGEAHTRWYWERVDWGKDGNTPVGDKRWVAKCDNDDCPCYIQTKGCKTEEEAIEVWDNLFVYNTNTASNEDGWVVLLVTVLVFLLVAIPFLYLVGIL